MTQWDAIASDILREHATKVAVCCIALSMVFWLASQVKKHCCAQRQSVQAACGKGSRNRSSKHTHWTRRLPGNIYIFELGHGSHRSKLVPKCGEVLGSKAQTGALCLACAYPPCESCGSLRPQESRYRVNVMPQWTCEACSVKSCPKVRANPWSKSSRWCMVFSLCISALWELWSPTAKDAQWIPCAGHANMDVRGVQREQPYWGPKERLRRG